jgi:hypothetical protein
MDRAKKKAIEICDCCEPVCCWYEIPCKKKEYVIAMLKSK